jgi:ubiquitin-conjugating enzyme (huntingtin interacting protein 2)
MALISLRMLLESPNPKDPQDAQVAAMMLEDPERFAKKAHEWAVMYAGAPRRDVPLGIYKQIAAPPKAAEDPNKYENPGSKGYTSRRRAASLTMFPKYRYQGYNKDLIDRFVNMGFDVGAVVEAFNFVGIDRNGGEDYELEEAYMGDITARLLGEQ